MRVIDPSAIRNARLLRGWTQYQLGVLCGVSQQAAQKIEAGELTSIRPEVARELSRNLGLDLEAVFEYAPVVPTPVGRSSGSSSTKVAS